MTLSQWGDQWLSDEQGAPMHYWHSVPLIETLLDRQLTFLAAYTAINMFISPEIRLVVLANQKCINA